MADATVTLKRTEQKMPLVGLGLWKIPKSSCADIVYKAVKTGYRLFDGAGDYGNEKEAGEGIRRALREGLVKREELFITSKLWNTFHAHDHVIPMAKKQLEYVDPDHRYPPEWFGDDGKVHTANVPIQETWGAMEELVDEGLAKNIGLSNFSGASILDVLRYARIEPQVLQVELHPYLAQEGLVELAHTFGITVTAYSSFGPQTWYELGEHGGVKSLLTHDVVVEIAKARQQSPAQVLLRWATQRGIAVIPKSNNVDRLAENLLSVSFDLSADELNKISSLNANMRFNDPKTMDPRLAIFV